MAELSQDRREPKSSILIETLPFGYLDDSGELHSEVEVRELTGDEEDIISNQSSSMSSRIHQVLLNVTNRIGRFTDRRSIEIAMSKQPMTDDFALLLFARRATYGDEMTISAECPEKKCGHEAEYKVDLSEIRFDVEEPRVREFEVEIPSGAHVVWKLPNRKVDSWISEVADVAKKDQLTWGFVARIIQITTADGIVIDFELPPIDQIIKRKGMRSGGVQKKIKLTKEMSEWVRVMKKMSLKDRHFLRNEFNDKSGMNSLDVEVKCSSCGVEFSRDLDLGVADFLFPALASQE